MHGDSKLFPPTPHGTNYTIKKLRIKVETIGKKYAIWNVIINGFKFNFYDLIKVENEVNARA